MTDTKWHLMRGDTCLGLLTLRNVDQPMFDCHFAPRPEFSAYESLFEAEARALETGDAAYDHLAAQVEDLGLMLVGHQSGSTVDGPLIHISKGAAWFRY